MFARDWMMVQNPPAVDIYTGHPTSAATRWHAVLLESRRQPHAGVTTERSRACLRLPYPSE
jgi:hypothetical protein